nr:TetR/AcrR family transcriptional regulator [uncultured Brevundimonas sp.]
MARRRGQVDERKSEAILDAATTLFADRGLQAKMEDIAKLAGVSKQTLYNRFASKLEIAQALANQRSDLVVAPLKAGGEPAVVLEAFGRALLERICHPDKVGSIRGVSLMSVEAPEIAQAIYEAGPKRSLNLLAGWMAEQTRQGRLDVPNPNEAAEMFSGLVMGHAHLKAMLGIDQIDADTFAMRAHEAARIFTTAYAPRD